MAANSSESEHHIPSAEAAFGLAIEASSNQEKLSR
jgi:hypothetical protein